MQRTETKKLGATVVLMVLKVVLATVVGAFVNAGEYGMAAFAACLFIDATR
jgi:hypothetical protein